MLSAIKAEELNAFKEDPSCFWLNPARYDHGARDMGWLNDDKYLLPPSEPYSYPDSAEQFMRRRSIPSSRMAFDAYKGK